MNKEIVLDVDGLVILGRDKYFSETYSKEYGVPLEEVMPFFKGEYKRAAIGKINIREVLPSYLKKWGWKNTTGDFLRYWFESEREIDERVMGVVDRLRAGGSRVHLASDNELNRANYLMDVVGLREKFDRTFFSYKLGHTKSDPEFFEIVLRELQAKPEEVSYWDDDPKNVEVAKGLRIQGNVYSDFEEFKRHFE